MRSCVVVIVVLAIVGCVAAQGYPSLSILNDFSAFTCGNFASLQADNQGRLAAGANVSLTDYEVGTSLPTNCKRADLIAGNNVNLFNAVVGHGLLVYGNTLQSQSSTYTCGQTRQPNYYPFASWCSQLKNDSANIGFTPANSPSVLSFTDLQLNGTNSGNNIFGISASTLQGARSIHINVPLDSWATINVGGSSVVFSNTNIVLSSSVVLEKVLFNFYQATSLNIFAVSVSGSILAPLAAVQFDDGNIDGSIASASFNGTGEIHLHPYIPPACNCSACPPQYQLPQWSIFARSNVNQSDTDDEGNFAAGGNVYLQNYAVGSALPSFGPAVDMVVGGNLQFSVGQVYQGSVLVGGTATTTNVGLPNGSIYQKATIPIDFSSVFQQLGKFSRSLSQMKPTGSPSFSNSVLTLTGSNPTVNVFNIPSNATAFSQINISAPAGSWVVVNFPGSSGSLANGKITLSGVSFNTVIYNFFEAKLLDIEGISVSGGVLAPGASLTFNNGNVNGCLWVDSIQGNGETHYFPPPPFTPECPPCNC